MPGHLKHDATITGCQCRRDLSVLLVNVKGLVTASCADGRVETEVAFYNFRFARGAGVALAYACSAAFCVAVRLYIVIALLLLALVLYVLAEYRLRQNHAHHHHHQHATSGHVTDPERR